MMWKLPPTQWRDQRCPMCQWRMNEMLDQCRTFKGKRYHVLECPCCHHRELAVEVIKRD